MSGEDGDKKAYKAAKQKYDAKISVVRRCAESSNQGIYANLPAIRVRGVGGGRDRQYGKLSICLYE